jgi:hypothetical protein
MNVDNDPTWERIVAEYTTWEALAAHIQGEDIDAGLKTSAIDAVHRLSQYLGENWPATALREDHPLAELFTNSAPWTRSYLSELPDAMDAVAPLPRWNSVKKRLRQADQAPGAIFELDLAARALSQGLHVVLEPPSRGGRRADLAVSSQIAGPESLYVEARSLRALPQKAYDANELFSRVFPLAIRLWNLTGGGRFLRYPRLDEIPKLVRKAEAFWEERRRNRDQKDLVIDGLLEMWGADQSNHDAHRAFVARGYPGPNDFQGPPITLDAFDRIYHAIAQKSDQLPNTAGGLIALKMPAEPGMLGLKADVIAREVAGALQPFRHVNAVALIGNVMTPDAPVAEMRPLGGGSVFIASPLYLIYAEEVILVRNPARRYADADTVINRLFER